MKTYAWIHATANSNINIRIKTKDRSPQIIMLVLSVQVVMDSRNKRRCPAVSLAASRSPKAIGWARRLMDSIHTIRGIKSGGVP